MDATTAKANLVPGKEVAQIARAMDSLLQNDCGDASVIKKLLPFLGQNLLEKKVIEYSSEPGVDITNRYFVLWEPFARAKAALLVGTIVEKAEKLTEEDLEGVVPLLMGMMNSNEDIELTFAFLAITNIGLKLPQLVIPQFQTLAKIGNALVNIASHPPKAFSLFHSIPFQNEIYESFLNLCLLKGVFETPENLQKFIQTGLLYSLLTITKASPDYVQKRPEMEWNLLYICLRLITEFPGGGQLFDLDRLPIDPKNNPAIVLRIVSQDKQKAGAVRNILDAIPQSERNQDRFAQLTKQLVSK